MNQCQAGQSSHGDNLVKSWPFKELLSQVQSPKYLSHRQSSHKEKEKLFELTVRVVCSLLFLFRCQQSTPVPVPVLCTVLLQNMSVDNMRLLDYELSPLYNVFTRDGVRNVICMRDISDGILQQNLSITQRKFYVKQYILNI